LEQLANDGDVANGFIGFRVRASFVLPNLQQQLHLVIFRQLLAQRRPRAKMCRLGYARHDATRAGEDIDRRKMAGSRQLPREIDVAVEDGADFFADRRASDDSDTRMRLVGIATTGDERRVAIVDSDLVARQATRIHEGPRKWPFLLVRPAGRTLPQSRNSTLTLSRLPPRGWKNR
jgi:hypothetical protein